MNILKKTTFIWLILLIATTTPIYAKFETWSGVGFISHTATLDVSEKEYFKTINKNTNSIDNVIYIGPSIDLMLYPYSNIPIGLKLTSQFIFPIGYNKEKGFRSFHSDFKNRNMIGLTYEPSFSKQAGMFMEFGYEYDHYRMAKTNQKNSKITPEFFRFNNQALYGEIGLLTTTEDGYFKFGINYSHSIQNKASSYDLIFAGGFKF